MAKEAQGKLRLKAIDSMSKVIDKVKNKIPKMTSNFKKAAIATQLLKQKTKSLRKSLTKTGRAMKGIGKGMSLGLTAPIVALGVLSLNTAANFEKSMNKVAALSGATGKPLKKLTEQAKRLGRESQFSASQTADAQAFLAQAGFKTNEILSATPAVLSLAAASSTDLATAADIASNVMGAFNIKAKDTAKVADVLALATARGNTDMIQLAEAMKDAGPVAKAAGSTIEETSALIAKLGDSGIQGSKAGTTLKNMFLKMSAPTKRIKTIMGGLGVEMRDLATGKLRPMTDILGDLNKSFQAKGLKGAGKLAVINEIFGLRAVAGANVLLNSVNKLGKDGVNSIQSLTNELKGAKGAAADMAKTMMKGLPGAITNLKSAFEGFQIAIFDVEFGGVKLKDIIEKNINKITEFLRKLADTSNGMLKWGLIIAGVVAVLGPIVLALGTVITMLPFLISGFATLAPIFAAIGAAVGAVSLPVLALVALLVTAAVMIFNAWTPIKAFFSDLFTSPLEQIKDMISFAGELASKIPFLGKLFGGDDTDAKLKAQGFKIGGPSGDPLGSRAVVKESEEKKNRDKKALLDVNFSNIPKGTNVSVEDKGNVLDSLTGQMAGGI